MLKSEIIALQINMQVYMSKTLRLRDFNQFGKLQSWSFYEWLAQQHDYCLRWCYLIFTVGTWVLAYYSEGPPLKKLRTV